MFKPEDFDPSDPPEFVAFVFGLLIGILLGVTLTMFVVWPMVIN